MKKLKIPDCRLFTGYKPCKPNFNCMENDCPDKIINSFGKKILIINLDAMGDVIMTTAQLWGIKRKFPDSTIFWITLKNALALIKNNLFIDFPLEWNTDNILFLQNIEIDYIFNADKSRNSCSLMKSLFAKQNKYGFSLNENGIIIPQNEYAEYNYLLGCDDNLKFRINKKTGQEILAETWDLPYHRDKYILKLTNEEKMFSEEFKKKINKDGQLIIGFNTGCSELYPNKKFSLEQLTFLIGKLSENDNFQIVLLGGKEDTDRNQFLFNQFKGKIINTPSNEGLRRGLCYINSCDIIITGDSFGMHASIALDKYVLAWFGLSCPQEIELYDNGLKFFNNSLNCAPCWKKSCPFNLECRDTIDLNSIVYEIDSYYKHNFLKI